MITSKPDAKPKTLLESLDYIPMQQHMDIMHMGGHSESAKLKRMEGGR